ncbi:LysM peptidoglycan-binding domain-containing protein [Aneurinibacillus sp. Ricciae_BoGa-3]|uniref:LysM peptidoglycan-binding domain-containing protein n=1 Tax=Aneurinibacillus sp. Ricciae_BoGa-3 TaxID=3022697 RepID=UPI0023418C17|nr:LysM peptidoglycan-binding domain-containing protein [Aneurinibacillus sp. Ricciae_BoGa-3]WCK53664.1 LysM peptidoglycan-binding domain-containing protein [Aneurinibacillus sp. Ricciae_BoGa-3]
MNQGNHNMLSFPVQDAFFVNHNEKEIQEIDEIELTPVISIQETDDDITISGYLLLAGKYIGKQEGSATPFMNNNSPESPGYIDSVKFNPFAIEPVDYTEEEIPLITFSHRTPVHIRIPRERVKNIKDVFATISAFDYDIQSSRKLTITAELALNGITQFISPSAAEPEEVEEAITDKGEESRILSPGINAEWLVAGDVFSHAEQAKQPETKVDNISDTLEERAEIESDEQEEQEEQEVKAEEVRAEPAKAETAKAETAKAEPTKAEANEAKTELAIIKDAIQEVKAEKKAEESPAGDNNIASKEAISEEELKPIIEEERALVKGESREEVEQKVEQQKEDEEETEDRSAEAVEEESEPEEQTREEVKVAITLKGTKSEPVTVNPSTLFTPKPNGQDSQQEAPSVAYAMENRNENENISTEEEEGPAAKNRDSALYLTTFMSQEETYTRLKMCIAQNDETLDAIAERYSVTPADIAQANGLHTNVAIAKGQVLYIPVRS